MRFLRGFHTSCVNYGRQGLHGPNTLYRAGVYVTGTRPDPMKYFKLNDKAPTDPYGYQDNNHLLEDFGKVAETSPIKVKLQKDKVYAWCSCGHSGLQPLCDGNHNRLKCTVPNLKPVRFIPDRDMQVWLCRCKQTKNRPFCDGSHKDLVPPDPDTLAYAIVKKRKR